MTIEIYNTLSRRKEALVPLESGHVRMYVCGVTVYDYCHIGHGRTFAAFDVAQRWLRARGYRVTYVRNVTDIEDKIIKRAAERGVTPTALAQQYTQYMQEDLAALGCATPDQEPRATDYVPQMLGIIDLLEKEGLAYQAEDGDVDFAVRQFPGYGMLSGKSLDELRAGERVAVDRAKRDPLDFVLWKRAKPGEPEWPSRWGAGRPGWHIECSAMASELLGRTFDIHGGGPDLIFPHHENEIAQSEGAFKQPFANIWMHSAALRVGDEKMSKSLGNFWTIRDALAATDTKYGKGNGAEVLRFFLIRPHYRHQINFSEPMIAEAREGLMRFYAALDKYPPAGGGGVDWDEPYARRFAAAMDDDFNTAQAVAVLFELVKEVNTAKSLALARQLKGLGGVLGLLQIDPKAFLQGRGPVVSPGTGELRLVGHRPTVTTDAEEARIENQITLRAAAKKAKNYAEADRIRKTLADEGIVLEDSAAGTTWRRQ
jgi:cysteinyl-tRNA synthetase